MAHACLLSPQEELHEYFAVCGDGIAGAPQGDSDGEDEVEHTMVTASPIVLTDVLLSGVLFGVAQQVKCSRYTLHIHNDHAPLK
jgi:hypothetical protein